VSLPLDTIVCGDSVPEQDIAMCDFCGLPERVHERCADCGYTYCDAQFLDDHRLCGSPTPMPPEVFDIDKPC